MEPMVGATTASATALESPPPGFVTCTLRWPAAASRLAGTAAVSVPPLTNAVASATPFKVTVDCADAAAFTTKFAPVTVRVIAPEPAGTDAG